MYDIEYLCILCCVYMCLVTFKLYDVDADNFISNADLFHVLKAMVTNIFSNSFIISIYLLKYYL